MSSNQSTGFSCIKTSAPGKVILFGEHAVVYGAAAIAASLSDRRCYVSLEPCDCSVIEVCLNDLDLPIARQWKVDNWNTMLGSRSLTIEDFLPYPGSKVRNLLSSFLHSEIPENSQVLSAVVFLLWGTVLPLSQNCGLKLTVSGGTLPLGAGLGSSAAFSVAISAALLQFQKTLHFNDDSYFINDSKCQIPDEASLALINKWAFASETLLHGNPSGIDNQVSTFGQAILYRKFDDEKFEIIHGMPNLKVLIANTGVSRETKQIVRNVQDLRDKMPSVVGNIFDSISCVSQMFYEMVGASRPDYDLLDRLVEINHGLLRCLGVSHPQIEKIREILDRKGIFTKLTGAGGGGCTISFISESMENSVADIVKEVIACGFNCFYSEIGGIGVAVHVD